MLQGLGNCAFLGWLWDKLKQQTGSLVAPELLALSVS